MRYGWTCAAIITPISIPQAVSRYFWALPLRRSSMPTMEARSYSVSGQDSTRSMCGTAAAWTRLVGSLWITTPSPYGSFSPDKHEKVYGNGRAVMRSRADILWKGRCSDYHGASSGVAHQVFQLWCKCTGREFLRQ